MPHPNPSIAVLATLLLVCGIGAFDTDHTDQESYTAPTKTRRPATTTLAPTTQPPHQDEHPDLPSFDSFRLTTWRHVQCNSSQFLCENGRQCVDRLNLCNGVENCDDGSDEGGKCDECSYDNGGCEHLCRNTPGGAECMCHNGWRPSHDGISCEDEDECASGHGHCQHYCHNTMGGFSCSCARGYVLQSDGSTCRLEQHDAGVLLFSVGHQVRNLPLNSWQDLPSREMPDSNVVCDVRSGSVDGVDTNNINAHFYYTRKGGIYAHYEAEVCLVQGLHEFGTNVAVDWVTGNLYFVNEEPATLGLCRADGRFCSELLNHDDDLGTPRGLALHPKFGLMFWTDWGTEAKIERANMDGTDRRVIVDTRLAWPNAIAVDYVHNLVYFADSEFDLIERVRLDGSHREVVVKHGVFHPFDLVVFDDHIFWTDWGLDGTIMTASISNESDHRSLYQGKSTQPYGIGVLHPAFQERDLPNPCSNMTCSHICALTNVEYSHGRVSGACLCPLNYEFRQGQKLECIPTTNKTAKTGAHWCSDAFTSACEHGRACENGGVCSFGRNDLGERTRANCVCTPDYVGEYCEVKVTADMVIASQTPGTKSWVTALLIFLTFVLVTCVCCAVLCRFGKYRQKIHALSWTPSVLFRKTVIAAKGGRDCEQRQRIISVNEDGLSKSNLSKIGSFSNPVYEEVQVPVHHHAYTVFNRENSILSNDSDADSGLEFNTSNGSP